MSISTRLREFIRSNLMGIIACYLALAGTAYATHSGGANTISSGDIIDGQVASADLQNNNVRSADVRDDNVAGGGLAASDLGPNSVGASEVADDSLTGADVQQNSLDGGEIAQATLSAFHITGDSLTANSLASNSVGWDEVATSTFDSEEIASIGTSYSIPNDAIDAGELSPAAVPADGTGDNGSTKLAANSVDYDEISANAVRSVIVQDNSLTDADIDESTLRGAGVVEGAAGSVPPTVITLTGTDQTIVSEPIGTTGNYLLLGRVLVEGSGNLASASCGMTGDDGYRLLVDFDDSNREIEELVFMSTVTANGGSSVTIRCTGAGGATAYASRIFAIPIAGFN